ncbi:MAG: nitrate/nitrite transporter NrtS [Roseibium sp.]
MLQTVVLEATLSKPVLRRATIIAAIVGTLLGLINHGDKMLDGTLDGTGLFKIVLTYFVPFSVSLVSSVLTVMDREKARLNR